MPQPWDELNNEILSCRQCPRLVEWRERISSIKKRAYLDWDYWGKPVLGFGDMEAQLMVVGLAPGAHGSNRTGRMFTGDASGGFLFPALYRAGFANQPQANSRNDGLMLSNVFINAIVRCVPPQNKPNSTEISKCQDFLVQEMELVKPRGIVVLGRLAYSQIMDIFTCNSREFPFRHGAKY